MDTLKNNAIKLHDLDYPNTDIQRHQFFKLSKVVASKIIDLMGKKNLPSPDFTIDEYQLIIFRELTKDLDSMFRNIEPSILKMINTISKAHNLKFDDDLAIGFCYRYIIEVMNIHLEHSCQCQGVNENHLEQYLEAI